MYWAFSKPAVSLVSPKFIEISDSCIILYDKCLAQFFPTKVYEMVPT